MKDIIKNVTGDKRTAADEIRLALLAEQDIAYRDFHARLVPNLPKSSIIGVRTPCLRVMAKQLGKYPAKRAAFMQQLPHQYYDENTLHGILIAGNRNFAQVMAELEDFLPYIDNWATCDLCDPKIFAAHTDDLLPYIRRWLADDHPYTVRFAVNALMRYYLDEKFLPQYADWVAAINNPDYYVKMGAAWYFATALAKQYKAVLPILEQKRLDVETHNKTIQKAIESRRITPQQKTCLRSLKIKA